MKIGELERWEEKWGGAINPGDIRLPPLGERRDFYAAVRKFDRYFLGLLLEEFSKQKRGGPDWTRIEEEFDILRRLLFENVFPLSNKSFEFLVQPMIAVLTHRQRNLDAVYFARRQINLILFS